MCPRGKINICMYRLVFATTHMVPFNPVTNYESSAHSSIDTQLEPTLSDEGSCTTYMASVIQ